MLDLLSYLFFTNHAARRWTMSRWCMSSFSWGPRQYLHTPLWGGLELCRLFLWWKSGIYWGFFIGSWWYRWLCCICFVYVGPSLSGYLECNRGTCTWLMWRGQVNGHEECSCGRWGFFSWRWWEFGICLGGTIFSISLPRQLVYQSQLVGWNSQTSLWWQGRPGCHLQIVGRLRWDLQGCCWCRRETDCGQELSPVGRQTLQILIWGYPFQDYRLGPSAQENLNPHVGLAFDAVEFQLVD